MPDPPGCQLRGQARPARLGRALVLQQALGHVAGGELRLVQAFDSNDEGFDIVIEISEFPQVSQRLAAFGVDVAAYRVAHRR